MTDAETSAAVDWLTRQVRVRDEAIRDGGDYADPEVFAAEVLAAMRGHGWRATPAKAYAAPKSVPPPTERDGRVAEMLAPVRARMDAINEAKRHARDAWRDGAA